MADPFAFDAIQSVNDVLTRKPLPDVDREALAMLLLRALSGRLAHQTAANLALLDTHSRVARVLIDTAHEVGGQWMVEPGAELIASMVGASREMVSRVVKQMLVEGILRRSKRKFVLLDRTALLQRAAPVAAATV